jgi:hypothetical protein
MKDEKSVNYQDFFKEELYDGFVRFLLNEYGSSKVINLIDDEPVITKKGVHSRLRRQFNEFLNKNPKIERKFVEGGQKFLNLRNVAGGTLYFPINSEDDMLMSKLRLRAHYFIPVDEKSIPRASNKVKNSAETMKGQILKGDWSEDKFIVPRRLTIHFKRGYAKAIGKTTICTKVESMQQVNNLLFDIYENKVAFAQFEDGKNYEFVKRNNNEKRAKRKSTTSRN